MSVEIKRRQFNLHLIVVQQMYDELHCIKQQSKRTLMHLVTGETSTPKSRETLASKYVVNDGYGAAQQGTHLANQEEQQHDYIFLTYLFFRHCIVRGWKPCRHELRPHSNRRQTQNTTRSLDTTSRPPHSHDHTHQSATTIVTDTQTDNGSPQTQHKRQQASTLTNNTDPQHQLE